MKKRFLFFCFLYHFYAFSQTDTSKLLPLTEITAERLNDFSVGQTHRQCDSLTLNLYQNQHLSDYLQSETPLSIRTYGTGLASVAARGMSANHTAILWNGINLQNPLSGLSDMAILEIGTTQHIDVKMGGNSALFGSGAIGGVIYLDNEKPKISGFRAQLGYGTGSYGWQNIYGQLDFSQKKIGGSIRIAEQNATNDFIFRNTAEIGQPLQHASHAAYKLLNINANIFAELSSQDFLKINFWNSDNYREITPTMTSRSDNAIYRDTANRLVGEWTHFFKKSYLKVRSAYLFDKNFYNSDIVQNSQNGINTLIGEAEWNTNLSPKNTLRTGINTTYDHSNNNNYTDNHQRTRFALFVNDAFTSKLITLTANMRQEIIEKRQPTTFSIGFEKNIIAQSPKTEKQKFILRGSFSRNFNVPTFNDLYWAELGNPHLQTEQGWSRELGLSYTEKKSNQALQAHFTLFYIDINNRIVWQPQNNGIWRPTNINRIKSKGIETWASYRWTTPQYLYKLNINYQFAHATDGDGGVQLFVPAHNGSLTGWIKYHNIYASWQQTASSKRYGTTDQTTWTNPFTIADATIGFTPICQALNKLDIKTDFRLRITNVFNTDYQVIRFYPNPKREFRVEGRFSFR